MGKISIALLIFTCAKLAQCFICNGDFETYVIPAGQQATILASNYSCWYERSGIQIEVQKMFGINTTKVLELAYNFPNVVCQNVTTLVVGQMYRLNFSVYNHLTMVISEILLLVNNQSVFNHTTQGGNNFSNASFILTAATANTQFCFDFFLNMTWNNPSSAPCLDNITLQLYIPAPPPPPPPSNSTSTTNATNTNTSTNISSAIINITIPVAGQLNLFQVIKWPISIFLSVPNKLIVSLRCAYLVLDDVWLYDYSRKNLTGLIAVIFETITSIQLMKFEYLERFFGWNQYKQNLGLSDYRMFSTEKFVEVEGASSVFIDSNFAFFVYTAPQDILFCLGLLCLFEFLRQYKVSKYIRKFYFVKTTLMVALVEENLNYFVFVCFSHLRHPFSFNFADKLSLVFTVSFLFGLCLFSFSFYMLIFKYLERRASYFTEFTFRECAGFFYKTVQFLVRNFLRATIFCFFHNQYRTQLVLLGIVEVVVIANSIALQTIYDIFLSKFMYILNISYCFLFVLLNLSLLIEDLYDPSEAFQVIKQAEEVIIYFLIGDIVLMMILDFLSFSWSRILTKQEFERELVRLYQKNPKLQPKKAINPPKSRFSFNLKKKEKNKGQFQLKRQNQPAIVKKLKDNFIQIKKKENYRGQKKIPINQSIFLRKRNAQKKLMKKNISKI